MAQGWTRTYRKHGTDAATGYRAILAESGAAMTRTMKKYTGR
jgi:hypothetical protein